jgi:uncharacterized membrane protein
MFYLKEFFKSLGESLLKGGTFFLFSCLLALALTHRPWLSSTIEKITPEKMVNPYFVTVIDGSVDVEHVRSFMSKLPGVVSVMDKDTATHKSRLNDLIGQLGSSYSLGEDLMDFKTLRIVLNPRLSSESLQFVRDQAVKFAGKEKITATDVKYPEVAGVMNTHPFYQFLSRAGDWGVIAVLALLWGVSYLVSYDVFRSRGYIIEKFQRRKLVAAKTLAAGLTSVIALFMALGIWHGTLQLLDLLVLFMVFSVFWTFSMQNWRWKSVL